MMASRSVIVPAFKAATRTVFARPASSCVRAFSSEPTRFTESGHSAATTTLKWPPSRSQLVRMMDPDTDYDESEAGVSLGGGSNNTAGGEPADYYYYDDHHAVAEGSTSLSPHHEGYEEVHSGRIMDLAAKVRMQEMTANLHSGDNNDLDDMLGGGLVDFGNKQEKQARAEEARETVSSNQGGDDKKEGGDSSKGWSWARPTPSPPAGGKEEDGSSDSSRSSKGTEIPVLRGKRLTVEEVVGSLEACGGTDIQVVDVRGKGSLGADAMIFVSGRSGAHLRRMADILVVALKRRRLKHAPGVSGAEGYEDNHWMIVDCENLIVQIMQPVQRKALGLEKFWGSDEYKGVVLQPGMTEAQWESEYERVVSEHPASEDYDPFKEDQASRERNFRKALQMQRLGKRGGGTGQVGSS